MNYKTEYTSKGEPIYSAHEKGTWYIIVWGCGICRRYDISVYNKKSAISDFKDRLTKLGESNV